MKSSRTLQEHLAPQTLELLINFEAVPSEKFTDLVGFLDLDPTSDFQQADLSYVSFDECDLRGYNFSGANLTGATGRNVVWDKTTVIEGASLDGSLFSYPKSREEFFRSHPDWYQRFLKLKSGYWLYTSVWVADNIKPGVKNRSEAIQVAKALFEETSDTVARTNILFFLSQAFEHSHQHRDFLIHTVNRFADSKKILAVTVRVLGVMFPSDKVIFELLRRIMFDEAEAVAVRQEAARGVLVSKYFREILPEISGDIQNFGSEVRRYYVRRIASFYGQDYIDAVTELNGSVLDFVEPISDRTVLEIARGVLLRQKVARRAGAISTRGQPVAVDVGLHEVFSFSRKISDRLLFLSKNGIPFRMRLGSGR